METSTAISPPSNSWQRDSCNLEPPPPLEPPSKASSSWAALIKRVYEVDPLVCDKCGGAMKIVAFIQQEREINKICDNLGYPKYRAPPPLHKTNSRNDRTIESVCDDYDQSSFN